MRIGLVGLGKRGMRVLGQLTSFANISKVVVVEARHTESSLTAFNRKFDSYTHIDECLTSCELDGVIDCSSSVAHFAHAKSCIDRGIPILVEKPVAVTAREFNVLLDLDRDSKLVSCVSQTRFQLRRPLMRRIIEVLGDRPIHVRISGLTFHLFDTAADLLGGEISVDYASLLAGSPVGLAANCSALHGRTLGFTGHSVHLNKFENCPNSVEIMGDGWWLHYELWGNSTIVAYSECIDDEIKGLLTMLEQTVCVNPKATPEFEDFVTGLLTRRKPLVCLADLKSTYGLVSEISKAIGSDWRLHD